MSSPCVYVIATMDTKGSELTLVRDRLLEAGVSVRMVDVGTLKPPVVQPDVSRTQVLAALKSDQLGNHTLTDPEVTDLAPNADRGQAIAKMAEALKEFLLQELSTGQVSGVLGLGGSGGTSLITTAMRALPIGLPKLMVSTVASGNVAPYVDCSDICMLYSVVDIAGLNAVSAVVLSNAAHAMVGMVKQGSTDLSTSDGPLARAIRPALGMTMFGVTTSCVDQVRRQLEDEGYDCLVFHATGSGGRAMEQLVASGLITGVLDITTTEVADEIAGGVFPSGPQRFERLLQAGVPLVLSLGALDMVNFGALDSVPEKYRHRQLHVHNAQVTLMRTTPEENRAIARFIADKLNTARGPVTVLIPAGGISLLDAPGQPFWNPDADGALFDELERQLQTNRNRQLVRLPYHINSPEFSTALVEHFRMLKRQTD